VTVIPDGATTAQIGQLERNHKSALLEFNMCRNVQEALKRQLLLSVNEMYYRALKQPHIAYANRTCRTLLEHLFNNYGQLHPIDLIANANTMRTAWDPTAPVENLIAQIDDAIEFAASGNKGFTPEQILSNAYALVFDTDLYNEALEDWDILLAANQTWHLFKAHILLAQK
jgi:hypothetical protein